jgi:hypothetical protein
LNSLAIAPPQNQEEAGHFLNPSSQQAHHLPKTFSGWWFGTFFISHFIYGIIWAVILPIDFHMFQDGYCTTNEFLMQNKRVSFGMHQGMMTKKQMTALRLVRQGEVGPWEGKS